MEIQAAPRNPVAGGECSRAQGKDGGRRGVPLLGLGHLTAVQASRLAMKLPRFPLRESWGLEGKRPSGGWGASWRTVTTNVRRLEGERREQNFLPGAPEFYREE